MGNPRSPLPHISSANEFIIPCSSSSNNLRKTYNDTIIQNDTIISNVIRKRNNRIKLNAVDVTDHYIKPCPFSKIIDVSRHTATTINPYDIVCTVIQYLDVHSICNIQLVNKQLHYHCKSHVDSYRYLTIDILSSHNDVDNSLQSIVSCIPYTQSLNINASPISTMTQSGVVYLRRLHWLKHLSIDNTDTLLRDTYKLFTLHHIESIELTGTLITNTSIQHLCNNIKLSCQSFKLNRYNLLTDACIDYILQCNSLHSLQLTYCNKLTDNALHKLSSNTAFCNNIRHLSLAHCTGLTDQSIECIMKLMNIESLDVSGCNQLSTGGMKQLFDTGTLLSLKSINISKLHCIDHSIIESICNDVMLSHSLTYLNIEYCTQLHSSDITLLNNQLHNCVVMYSMQHNNISNNVSSSIISNHPTTNSTGDSDDEWQPID